MINSQKNTAEADLGATEAVTAAEMYERLMPFNADSSRFALTCRRGDYSAGRIARAIEDCNANVLNLNVTSDAPDEDTIVVDVRVDRKNIDSIARSLARYDYTVVGVCGDRAVDEAAAEEQRRRVAELLRYIDI